MSNNAVLITISSLSLVVSSTTLVIVIVGGFKGLKAKKKIEAEVEIVKTKANDNLSKLKNALNGIEI